MLSTYPRELRLAVGLSRAVCADFLNISTRTLARWENAGGAPEWALTRLYQRAYGFPLEHKEWRGWRFFRGQLVSPDGLTYTPGELRAWQIKQQELDALRRQFRRWCDPGHQLEFWPGSTERAFLRRGY